MFKHYGVDVLFQRCECSFADFLKQQGVEYTVLPYLDDIVLRYNVNGVRKYAYITYPNTIDEYVEYVYITTEIPEDLNWKNIESDRIYQEAGDPPMELPTRARVIFDDCKHRWLQENPPKDLMVSFKPRKPDPEEMSQMFIGYNTNLEELKEMDHHDVPELDEEEYNEIYRRNELWSQRGNRSDRED